MKKFTWKNFSGCWPVSNKFRMEVIKILWTAEPAVINICWRLERGGGGWVGGDATLPSSWRNRNHCVSCFDRLTVQCHNWALKRGQKYTLVIHNTFVLILVQCSIGSSLNETCSLSVCTGCGSPSGFLHHVVVKFSDVSEEHTVPSQIQVVDVIRKKRCVGYGHRFKDVWPITASEGGKKGQDFTERRSILDVRFSRTYFIFTSCHCESYLTVSCSVKWCVLRNFYLPSETVVTYCLRTPERTACIVLETQVT
jgi:hypothetical protein